MANLKILTVTTLYPNACQPRHGIFVENRLRHLVATGLVESQVVAPIPWFPFGHERFGDYAKYADIPGKEERHGMQICHPRYVVTPKVGMTITPFLLYVSLLREVRRMIASGYDFDLIDAHYFYPDGVAAAMLARKLKKPLVITARGTDINLIPEYILPKKQILWAAEKASGVVTVCRALKDRLVELGSDEKQITVLRNGVDLKMFAPPQDREQLKKRLAIQELSLFSVGHLIERKGHHLAIKAMKYLAGFHLYIAGDGQEMSNLQKLTDKLNLNERVHFLGEIPHERLNEYYGSVDALVLASSREGWANVLLESMACGTPVVVSDVGGAAEVVTSMDAGILCKERTPEMIACSVKELFSNYPARAQTRSYAERFSWQETTEGQLRLFIKILQG